MIQKTSKGYVVNGESGRPMGTYKTLLEAKKRLGQIEYFKHAKKGGR
jgi:hypothetical protein